MTTCSITLGLAIGAAACALLLLARRLRRPGPWDGV